MTGAGDTALRDRFIGDVLANRHNRAIFDRWQSLGLDDGWLVAGCLFQSVWNVAGGRPAEDDIKDYDLFYFDATDLTREGEARVQRRIDEALGDLGVALEVANQARVHLWYPEFFGVAYPPLHCSRDGIDRFLVRATCVGMRPSAGGFEVYAPYGLHDLYRGALAPNPLRDFAALYREKVASYRARWPWLVDGDG